MADDLVYAALERVAESAGDINDRIYARYFELCPQSAEVMMHTDEGMRGRMLEEVFRLVLNPEPAGEEEYLEFEVDNHRAYGAEPHMYRNVLQAVRDVVRDEMSSDWTADIDAAWQARIDALGGMIEAAAARSCAAA